MRVGVVRYVGEAHNFVALEKEYFRKNGVAVEFVLADAGVESLRRLLAGEVDIATVALTPVVFAALDQNFLIGRPGPEFVILANLLQSSRLNFAVARSDRGISSPLDLEGKTIALTFDTASEYFWYAFALYHGIDTSKVRLVHSRMGDMLTTIRSGEVDAFIGWEPIVQDIRDAMDTATTVFPATQFYVSGWLALTTREFASQNTVLIERYLEALHQAESTLRDDPVEAMQMHARRISMQVEQARRLYQNITFNMTLDEALILNLEEQAKWAAQTKFGGQKPIPDFRSLIFDAPLRAVKPHAINIVR